MFHNHTEITIITIGTLLHVYMRVWDYVEESVLVDTVQAWLKEGCYRAGVSCCYMLLLWSMRSNVHV